MMISGICEGVYIYSSCDGVVMERNPYGFWRSRSAVEASGEDGNEIVTSAGSLL